AEVDLEAAAGAEAADCAGGPGRGEGGEQVEFAGVALEEHLGDAGGEAEVAVDLEGGVGVEQVRVDAAGPVVLAGERREELPGAGERLLAVAEAGPEVDLPRQRPAGAAVAAD